MSGATIWVGRKSGEVVVYDPGIQVDGSDFVPLWNASNETLETYIATVLRETVQRERSDSTVADFGSKYIRWLSSSAGVVDEQRLYLATRLERERGEEQERKARIAREAEEAEARRALIAAAEAEREREARMTPAERHSRFLAERGLPNQGVQPRARGSHHRVTTCYSCKAKLDNSIDVECKICGWIVCGCGACGCGYGL